MEVVVFNSLLDRDYYLFFHPERLDGYKVRNGHCQACARGESLECEVLFTDPVTGLNAYAPYNHVEATIEHPDPMRR